MKANIQARVETFTIRQCTDCPSDDMCENWCDSATAFMKAVEEALIIFQSEMTTKPYPDEI